MSGDRCPAGRTEQAQSSTPARIRNDRVLAIPVEARREHNLAGVEELSPRLRQEPEQFAIVAGALEGKDVRVVGWRDAVTALELVRDSAAPSGSNLSVASSFCRSNYPSDFVVAGFLHAVDANVMATLDAGRMFGSRVGVALMIVLVVLVGGLVAPLAQRGPASPEWPGVKGKGVTLLPNGWRIAPAGRSIAVGDFPMSMVLSADGRHAIVSNNGWSKPSLTMVDLAQQSVKARVPVDHAWLGLTWHPGGDRLYSSGAAENTVNEFRWSRER
ncbi:MAG: hypothetical protein H0W08_04345 [Acidobacteria bacterium]|nr:hypothetical protein [Acidobacteriota bacterium]